MSDGQQLVRQGEQLPAGPAQVGPAEAPNLLTAIIALSQNPSFDVEKLERLCAMQERLEANQRKAAFMAALAELQAELPQIQKDGRIIVKEKERSRYARLEDIDAAIRPMLAKYGFAFSFNEESVEATSVRFSATLSHRGGHSEVKLLTVPVDKAAVGQFGPVRTAIQDAGSTASYARRYLIKMHLNLIERDEDNDGMGPENTITPEQALDIEAMLTEVKGDKAGFLKYMGVEKIGDILERDHRKAIESIQAKRRSMK